MIKLYTTPTCPYCILVKDFLKERGHSWEEIDVTRLDIEVIADFRKIGGPWTGVPVTDLNGKIIVGWNKQALEETLSTHSPKSNAE